MTIPHIEIVGTGNITTAGVYVGMATSAKDSSVENKRFIRDFREAYSRNPLIRERLGRRFHQTGVGGEEAGRLKLLHPRAVAGGAVSGHKLLCLKHLRSFRALDPPRRSRFLYPGIRGRSKQYAFGPADAAGNCP